MRLKSLHYSQLLNPPPHNQVGEIKEQRVGGRCFENDLFHTGSEYSLNPSLVRGNVQSNDNDIVLNDDGTLVSYGVPYSETNSSDYVPESIACKMSDQ